MPAVRRPKSTKNPPFLSHEFVIQNHADIVSCVAMVFVIGLMFQATNPVASLFVAMQHNMTVNGTIATPDGEVDTEVTTYTSGVKDVFTVTFYLQICIVLHAVVQEYILDKLNRRMHLSKVKHSKFNESGQLLAFYVISAVWGANIIVQENYLAISRLWEGYPHANLPFIVKFYFIVQMAYWMHGFPELYFQKVKREEMAARVQYTTLYMLFITAAYALNFSRVALCLLVLHYLVEMVFHLARLLYFADKAEMASTGFMGWNILFVLVRLGTITLSVLTFWYGLEKTGQESMDVEAGNYNTQIVRINCLAALCLLQAWMMWNFITFQLKRIREQTTAGSTASARRAMGGSQKKKERKNKGKKDDDSVDEDSEVIDQQVATTENGTVRQRTPKSKRN